MSSPITDINTEKNFTLKFMKFYLNTSGISINREQEWGYFWLYKYFLIAFYIILSIPQVLSCLNATDVPLFAEISVYITTGMYLNFCTMNLHSKKLELFSIMKLMEQDFYKYASLSLELVYRADLNEYFRSIVRKYGKIYCMVYGTVCVAPVFTAMFSNYELGSPDTLMVKSRFPWRTNTIFRYTFTYLLQLICMVPLSVPCFGSVFFTIYFIVEVRAQTKKLCLSLKSIERICKDEVRAIVQTAGSTPEVFNNFGKPNTPVLASERIVYNKKSLDKLRQCVQHHQIIVKFMNNFVSILQQMFIGNLLYTISTVTLLGYTLMGNLTQLQLFGGYIALLCLVLMYFMVYCYIGEVITECNNQINDTLYDIDWYNLGTDFRRILLVFIWKSQKYQNVKAFVSYIASYELFSSVLKGCYSYMNLLLQSFS